MKSKTLLIAALAAILALPGAFAIDLETEMTLAEIQKERKVFVEAAVQPSPQQAKEFWEIYEAYRGDIASLNERTVKLIEEYAESRGEPYDDQAERMLKEATEIDVERVKVRAHCVKKMRKILIPKQVVRFLQIENKMDAMIQFDAAIAIPLGW